MTPSLPPSSFSPTLTLTPTPQFQGKKILLDCGIHPGYTGLDGLPTFDRIDPPSIDLLLITHFHLDHAASLPYFTERTGFRGRIFMTHPTKAVLRLLLQDYIRLMEIKSGNDEEVSDEGFVKSEEFLVLPRVIVIVIVTRPLTPPPPLPHFSTNSNYYTPPSPPRRFARSLAPHPPSPPSSTPKKNSNPA